MVVDKGKEMMPTGSGNVESSSGSVNTTTVEKDNPSQPLWRYVKKLSKGPGGGGNVMFSCKFCDMMFTGSYTRCKAHLLHISGVGIRPCPKVTNEEIKIFKKEQDAAETKKSSSKSSVSVPLYATEGGEDPSKKRKTLAQAFNDEFKRAKL
uniref:BED-type domain-containing protein n=1 Tax=Nymphaea colorata TaxID=210225 RepID=A0A5K0ZIQ4_9MAGN